MFTALELKQLAYAVLRNYEGLPRQKSGNDVDLMVRPEDVHRHLAVAIDVAQSAGWQLVQAVHRPFMTVVKFASRHLGHDGWPEVIHLDYFTVGSWYGAVFMEANPVLGRRRELKPEGISISIAHPVDELLHITAHHLLWSGVVRKEKYRSALNVLSRADRDELQKRLTLIFGPLWCHRVLEAASTGHRLTREEQWGLRRQLLWRRGIRILTRDVRLWARMVAAEVRQAMHPPGAVVLIECPGDELNDGQFRALVSWIRRIGQFNHGLMCRSDVEVISDDQIVLRRLRMHYGRRAASASRRLKTALGRGRRRGWIVCVAGIRGEEVRRAVDVVVGETALRTVPGRGWERDVVRLDRRREAAGIAFALVRLLAKRCERLSTRLTLDARASD